MSRKICGCSRELISLLFIFNRRLTSSCKCTQTYRKQILILTLLQVNIESVPPGVSSAAWLVLVILSKQCGRHHGHGSLLFIYSTHINWASPMLDTALIFRDIVVNNILSLCSIYWALVQFVFNHARVKTLFSNEMRGSDV